MCSFLSMTRATLDRMAEFQSPLRAASLVASVGGGSREVPASALAARSMNAAFRAGEAGDAAYRDALRAHSASFPSSATAASCPVRGTR